MEKKNELELMIEKVRSAINKHIYSPIEVLCSNDDPNISVSAFLILACGIDVIAGFYCGRNVQNARGLGREYRTFIKEYMSGYSEELLYKQLRCAWAHNLALGPNIAVTSGKSWIHNLRDTDGRVVKNLEELLEAFREAVNKYFEDLNSNKELQTKFLTRFRTGGIISNDGIDIRINNKA